MNFLAPNAASFVATSLQGTTFKGSLGVAATWADTVKFKKGYTWSRNLHFIDSEDDPIDGVCNVSQPRDCGNGVCILNAISNYTLRIQDTTLSDVQRQEALKFLDHFLGDVGQPLHVEAFKRGGNDIPTVCNGEDTELHATWDTGIIETNLKANFNSNLQSYVTSLITRIESGDFQPLAPAWIACSSTTATTPDSESGEGRFVVQREGKGIRADIMHTRPPRPRPSDGSGFPQLLCPLTWAQEANAFDCSVVFNFNNGTDLCTGDYFDNAVPVIDLQLAKQGYRLAMWLNEIFDGEAMPLT